MPPHILKSKDKFIIEDGNIVAFNKKTNDQIDVGSIKDMTVKFTEVRDAYKLATNQDRDRSPYIIKPRLGRRFQYGI